MVNYLLQNSILYIYVLHYGVLQFAPMSTVTVLQLVPTMLQLTRTGGQIVTFSVLSYFSALHSNYC